ncbi:LolA-related protein [Acidithiobacillus sp. AMEEHan]|uniref:LolA family protein n=1 Tax=Acidithiobacillus sp. AMEEHan TaxID=2994951 RepID=UPI0027E5AC27|nr:LolA-related protein [Acidithiobacillus sp. AMEEHan]
MTSGCKARIGVLGLLCLAPWPAGAQTGPWDLQTLLQQMAEVKSASASFTQTQTSPLLSKPLTSTGVLSYKAPDYLVKVTLAPIHETFILDHQRITISGGPHDQTQVFNVTDAPQISGLIGGIQAVLSGNETTLKQLYIVRLDGSRSAWELQLLPRSENVKKLVQSMTIYGDGRRLTRMKTISPTGSVTNMLISETITLAH